MGLFVRHGLDGLERRRFDLGLDNFGLIVGSITVCKIWSVENLDKLIFLLCLGLAVADIQSSLISSFSGMLEELRNILRLIALGVMGLPSFDELVSELSRGLLRRRAEIFCTSGIGS